jgi:predicted RNase H-like HicB family nuclease
MTRAVHVPYTVEQDEDGIWCAHAQLRPGVGANGEGDTADAAVADLREALEGLRKVRARRAPSGMERMPAAG